VVKSAFPQRKLRGEKMKASNSSNSHFVKHYEKRLSYHMGLDKFLSHFCSVLPIRMQLSPPPNQCLFFCFKGCLRTSNNKPLATDCNACRNVKNAKTGECLAECPEGWEENFDRTCQNRKFQVVFVMLFMSILSSKIRSRS